MALRWYLIQTHPRAEYQSASELEKAGFEIFFPRVKSPQPRRWQNDSPLFPGYIFVRLDSEKSGWPTIRPSHRAVGWVSFDGFVPDVPDYVVEELSNNLKELNTGHGMWEQFKCGDHVWISNGNLEGLGKVIQEAKSPQARAKVLLQFMGRLIKADVPWGSLKSTKAKSNHRPHSGRRTRGNLRWTSGSGPRQDHQEANQMTSRPIVHL